MSTIPIRLTLLGVSHTLAKYRSVVAGKPEVDEKHVRVWNIRKTEAIRINLVEFRGELPLHQHPDADHSLIVLEGRALVQVGGDRFEVEQGDFISVPKGVPHKYWAITPSTMLVSMDAPYYDPSRTIRLE